MDTGPPNTIARPVIIKPLRRARQCGAGWSELHPIPSDDGELPSGDPSAPAGIVAPMFFGPQKDRRSASTPDARPRGVVEANVKDLKGQGAFVSTPDARPRGVVEANVDAKTRGAHCTNFSVSYP